MRSRQLMNVSVGILFAVAVLALPANAALRGLWEFEDSGNLTAATMGVDLALTNPNGTQAAVAGSGTMWDQGAAQLGVGDYYSVTHGIDPNGGGSYVNQYTLLMDLNYPTAGIWRCLYQTNVDNGNDGDYFIHPSDESWGVGELGYTDGSAGTFFSSSNTWYRAVLTFDLGNAIKLYIDGNLVGNHNASSLDGRFALDPVFHVLADNDSEDGLMNLSNLAIWDEPLSANAVGALGGPGRQIIPEPNAIALFILVFAGIFVIRRRSHG